MSTQHREVARFGGVFVSADQRPPTGSQPSRQAYVTWSQPSATEEGGHTPASSVVLYIASASEANSIAAFFKRLGDALEGSKS